MATKSLRPKARDAALSRLDVAIEVLNVAKEISGIAPIQAALGSLGGLLTVIRVRSLLLRGGRAFDFMFVQDTMASEQGYVELGLSCADICQALDRGTEAKKSDENKVDEKKVDEKKLDEKKLDEKKVDEKKPVEKKVEEKKPAEKKPDEKKPAKKPNEKKPDEKKLDEPSQAVRATTNQPTKWVIPVVQSTVNSLTTHPIAELLRNPRERLPNRVCATHLPEPPVSQRANRKRSLLGGRSSTEFCMSSMCVEARLTGSY